MHGNGGIFSQEISLSLTSLGAKYEIISKANQLRGGRRSIFEGRARLACDCPDSEMEACMEIPIEAAGGRRLKNIKSRKRMQKTCPDNVGTDGIEEGISEGSGDDAKFRTLVEVAGQAGHGIMILQDIDGKEGVITFVNTSFAKALGYTRDYLLGKTVAQVIHPDSLPLVAQHHRSRQEGQYVPERYEVKALSRQGRIVPLEVSSATVIIDDKVSTIAFLTDISKRRQTEKRLRESEESYRQLVENINAVVYAVDKNGVLTYSSPRIVDICGRSASEFVGKKFTQFVHTDDLPGSMENLKKVLDGPLNEPWECRMVIPGSSEIYWVQGHNRPVYEDGVIVGFHGVMIDITNQKQAEEARRRSEEKYRLLVESSPDGVLSIDSKGRIVDCNSEVCRLLDRSRDDILGSDFSRIVANGALGVEQPFTVELDRKGFVEAELDMIHRDGRVVPVWAKLVARKDADQGERQVVVYLRDIAERRKVDELKDQFISLVSHELRTPLTVIMGAVNTALSEGERLPQAEVKLLIQDAAQGSEELSHILENLLELSRSRANKVHLSLDTVNLEEVLLRAVNKARRRGAEHVLTLNLSKKLPLVLADRIRLERILHNLIDNAIKYSPGGEIVISARRQGSCAVIEVRDKGIGISQEDLARLFQPFYRIRDESMEGTKGTGLGLLVCRKLVEAHGGRIWVQSNVGEGSAFFFTLPLDHKSKKSDDATASEGKRRLKSCK